jgi:hypothetical protein
VNRTTFAVPDRQPAPTVPTAGTSDDSCQDAYPFAIVRVETGYSAGGLQFAATITASSKQKLIEQLSKVVALHVAQARVTQTALEPPRPVDELDLDDYRAEGLDPEIVYVRPSSVNDVSVAIARALHEDAVTPADLARRLGVARSVVSRLVDPLYFGHSTRTLRGVARALDRRLVIALDPT